MSKCCFECVWKWPGPPNALPQQTVGFLGYTGPEILTVRFTAPDPEILLSGPLEADNAYQTYPVSLSSIAAFDVLRQLVEGLITEFDRAESDTCVALRLGWVQLPQSDDCLAVALLIERDSGSEYARIAVFVGAMIDLDQVRPLDASELHPIRISLAVGSNHIETPFAVDASIH
jgi:hypothetical protein